MSKFTRFLEKIFTNLGTFDHSIFKSIYSYLVRNYVLYYDNLQNYQERVNPPLKRKLLYHGYTLLLVWLLIKFSILTRFDDYSLKIMTGDVLHIFTSYYRQGYIFIINSLVVTILLRLVTYYGEKKMSININEIKTFKNGAIIFKYRNNEKRLIIIANSVYWLKKFYNTYCNFLSIIHIILSVIAYIFTDNNYNLLVMMVFTIQHIIFFKIIFSIYPGFLMLMSTTFMFLKLKQNDIIKSIRFNVSWRNKFRLYDNLKQYHQFTELVDKLSKLINLFCGIIYSISPFLISQTLWILIESSPKSFVEKLAQIAFIFMIVVTFILLYIFLDILSNITQLNQTLPKYLYPIFQDKQFTRFKHRISFNLNYNFGQLSDIMVRIKIDSFIARLNEEFVGFYCFNLFQLTKLTFFEYIYMLISDFVLIQDF